jgi:hypothetical protein
MEIDLTFDTKKIELHLKYTIKLCQDQLLLEKVSIMHKTCLCTKDIPQKSRAYFRRRPYTKVGSS